MSILYKNEHLNCFNYNHTEKPQIEVEKISKGVTRDLFIKDNEIVFVIEGRIRFVFTDFPEYEGTKGQILFLPVGGKYYFEALTNALVIIFRIHDSIKLCDNFKLESLFYDDETISDYQPRTQKFSILDISPRLWHFTDGIIDCIGDGLKCRCYFETKIKELFLLLRSYYSKEELHDFFFVILSEDTAFSEYVRLRWQNYDTVSSLAASMHLSGKQFYTRFVAIFGKSPQQWINEARAKKVYLDITTTQKQFKRIADENGFASDGYFTRFCQKMLGQSPTKIRKNMHSSEENGKQKGEK